MSDESPESGGDAVSDDREVPLTLAQRVLLLEEKVADLERQVS